MYVGLVVVVAILGMFSGVIGNCATMSLDENLLLIIVSIIDLCAVA